jgi:hypothetical protein
MMNSDSSEVTRSSRIGLVGCVKSKRSGRAPAKDLYTSPLFVGRRRYVERTCDQWFILSAKHLLLDPEQVIAYYDETLDTARTAERRTWSLAVLSQIDRRVGNMAGVIFEIHAGAPYRDYGLLEGLEQRGAVVDVPTLGLSFGRQLQFYGRGGPLQQSSRLAERSGSRSIRARHPAREVGQVRTPGGRYQRLCDHLSRVKAASVGLSFRQVEAILGHPLPASARRHRAWWGNGGHAHANAWLSAGWHVDSVNLSSGWVAFRRAVLP